MLSEVLNCIAGFFMIIAVILIVYIAKHDNHPPRT